MVGESGEILAASDDDLPPHGGDLPLRKRAAAYLAALRGDPPWLTPQQVQCSRRGSSDRLVHETLHVRRTEWGASLVVVEAPPEQRVQATDLQTTRLAALGFMVAGVCHEITNPLTSLKSMVQILSSEKEPDRALLERGLQTIARDVHRLLEITRRLVKYSRTGDEPLRPFAIDDAVVEALAVLRQGELLARVRVRHDPEPAARVVGHLGQIREVLLNLLVNALQAMGGEGRLAIETRVHGRCVEVRVQDSGPGVPADVAQRIFEPFFTTHPDTDGTGLGLAICMEIAVEHGGRIELLGSSGEGATFRLTLPSVEAS